MPTRRAATSAAVEPSGPMATGRSSGLLLALVATLLALVAVPPAEAVPLHDALVEDTPIWGPPNVQDGEVRSIVQVGSIVVLAGSFEQVEDKGTVVDQPYLLAYDRRTNRLVEGFRPQLDAPARTVADAGSGRVLVGGEFTFVDGVPRRRTVMLDLADGSVVEEWAAQTDVFVNAIAVAGGNVWLGGNFTEVNGEERSRAAVVSLADGSVLPQRIDVTGARGFDTEDPSVRSFDVSPDGSRVLLTHTGNQVAGEYRPTVAQLSSADGSLLDWGTLHYDAPCQQDIFPVPRDASYDTTGEWFVVVTGLGNFGPTCDVAVRFPSAATGDLDVEPDWVSRVFDQPESVDVSGAAVYVGGHFKCAMAPGTDWTDYPDRNLNFCPEPGDEHTHLLALNPEDGTAFPWDADVRSLRGVLAIEIVDDALLAGSDGFQWKGRWVGRHAVFELPESQEDTTAPEAAVTDPAEGATLPAGPATITGTATDDTGVRRVTLEVKDRATNQWLRRDGTFGAWQNLPATVTDTGATSTTFSLDVDLPAGSYRVYARAFDAFGNRSTRPVTRITVE